MTQNERKFLSEVLEVAEIVLQSRNPLLITAFPAVIADIENKELFNRLSGKSVYQIRAILRKELEKELRGKAIPIGLQFQSPLLGKVFDTGIAALEDEELFNNLKCKSVREVKEIVGDELNKELKNEKNFLLSIWEGAQIVLYSKKPLLVRVLNTDIADFEKEK